MSGPAHTPDPSTDRASVRRDLDALAALVERCGSTRDRIADGISGWSVEQHAYHAALATGLALQNVTNLCAEKGMLIQHDAEPSELFPQLVEQGFPRGQTRAPRMVVPPESVDAELLAQEFDGARAAADGLTERIEAVPGAPGRIRHQALGALTATEWLGFAAMHVAHHLMIATEVATALGDGPDAE